MEGNNGSRLGKFDMFEGVKLADQAHNFFIGHGLLAGYRNTILSVSYEVEECTRSEPLIWRKWVNVSSR